MRAAQGNQLDGEGREAPERCPLCGRLEHTSIPVNPDHEMFADRSWARARVLAERTGLSAEAWHKWLQRVPRQRVVYLHKLDQFCTATGRHISEFVNA